MLGGIGTEGPAQKTSKNRDEMTAACSIVTRLQRIAGASEGEREGGREQRCCAVRYDAIRCDSVERCEFSHERRQRGRRDDKLCLG